jgi:hypothetical protein
MIAAVAADLHGRPRNQVSDLLGLHDHERHTKDGVIQIEARRAREYVRRGRGALNALGVWPWTHARRGRLPVGWRRNDSFRAPLERWHETSCDELEAILSRNRAAFSAAVRGAVPAA